LVQIPSAFYTERLSTRKPFWAITTIIARASVAITGVLDIVVHWFVIEPPIPPANRSLSIRKRIIQPLENRDFLFFTLAMCIWFFGFGFFAPFMNVYLKSTFDVTYTHLSAIQLAGMISSII
ncbi:MAG: MFS transporter, partial [bacterium]|nr:MFS transporter [bacterium]